MRSKASRITPFMTLQGWQQWCNKGEKSIKNVEKRKKYKLYSFCFQQDE